jgi:anthranilate phosphoribosyltransferase
VTLNAAAALWVAEAVQDLPAGLERARESIDSGSARGKLDELVRVTNEAGSR